jgi:hypothetical protein
MALLGSLRKATSIVSRGESGVRSATGKMTRELIDSRSPKSGSSWFDTKHPQSHHVAIGAISAVSERTLIQASKRTARQLSTPNGRTNRFLTSAVVQTYGSPFGVGGRRPGRSIGWDL